ncbi:MAG: DUF222 domain-containing protein [Candidatus Nanopelagicales bacterium]
MYRPQQLPEVVAAVTNQVRSWADEPVAPSPQERADLLVGLRQLIDAAEAAFTTTLATFDSHGDGETLHASGSTSAWLRGALHLAPADASSRVLVARGAREHLQRPLTELSAGRVTFDQVRAIDTAVRRLPDDAKESAAELLTDLATRVDASQVRVAGRHLQHTLNPDGALAEANQQFERRFLHLSPLMDGMTVIDGLLDSEAATTLSTALAPFMVPVGPGDDRSPSQRRADGLVEVANAAMQSGKLPQLSGCPAQVQVLVPFGTLTGAGQEPAWLPESPNGSGWLTPPVSQRLLCDAQVGRVLLSPEGVPLDLGRYQRLFTPHQRRALAIRDGGCRFPDCTRPARYTDAHHVVSWTEGGPTDLPNALLLCRYHHRVVHHGKWTIRALNPEQGANARLHFSGPRERILSSDPRGP